MVIAEFRMHTLHMSKNGWMEALVKGSAHICVGTSNKSHFRCRSKTIVMTLAYVYLFKNRRLHSNAWKIRKSFSTLWSRTSNGRTSCVQCGTALNLRRKTTFFHVSRTIWISFLLTQCLVSKFAAIAISMTTPYLNLKRKKEKKQSP